MGLRKGCRTVQQGVSAPSPFKVILDHGFPRRQAWKPAVRPVFLLTRSKEPLSRVDEGLEGPEVVSYLRPKQAAGIESSLPR